MITSELFGTAPCGTPVHRYTLNVPEICVRIMDYGATVLGIDVPSARLPRWVQGAPDDGAQIRERDAAGRPQLVIDQGWRIDYLAYADDHPAALPARLDISRGEARIRLIIDSWTALP